jgi:hypothetical protein
MGMREQEEEECTNPIQGAGTGHLELTVRSREDDVGSIGDIPLRPVSRATMWPPAWR